MNNSWKKIQSFDRLHQAELRKDILEKNDIGAYIVNEKDSLLLIGQIDLYVHEKDVKKAKALIDEFSGLTKINSFIKKEPIEEFKNFLAINGIQTTLRVCKDEEYIKDNYELYIENDKLEQTLPFLTGENLSGWKMITGTNKVRQAVFLVEILQEKNIKSIIIKKKDSDFHLEEVRIYVEIENFESAEEVLQKMTGWIQIEESNILSNLEYYEEQLAYSGVKALISKESNTKYNLLVEASNEEKAIDIINIKSEWGILYVFPNLTEAIFYKDALELNGIPAVIINEMDSSFLLGEVELHVEKIKIDQAKEIINKAKYFEE